MAIGPIASEPGIDGPDSDQVVLLNPDGTPLTRPDDLGGDLGVVGASVVAGMQRLSRTTAAPGPRAGGTGDRVTRQGCDEEVVTPVLVPPDLAAATMADREFFARLPAGFTVDPASLQVDRFGLRWRAKLRTGHLCRRSANLRLYSSPSRNVTVLELIPDSRRRLIRTSAFVRRGVPAVGELAHRLGRLTG